MDDIFRSVLRIHPKPHRYPDDRTVDGPLTDRSSEYLDHVIGALGRIAEGRAVAKRPSKQIFADPETGGDFRVMPCVVRDQHGTSKTVNIVGTNVVGRHVPDQITVGRAFRLDRERERHDVG